MSENTLSDSQVEQLEEIMPPGGYQILGALADNESDGMTAPEIADALGWTEEEVEELLREMDDLGLIGPPLEERVYVGNPDYTLAEAADEMGMTVEEAMEAYVELEDQGLIECVPISEYEHVIVFTEDGQEAAREMFEQPDAHEPPGELSAELPGRAPPAGEGEGA